MLRIDDAGAPPYSTRPVQPSDALLLAGGGLVAGVVNTLAGGGSLLTVPLLTLLGLPGTVANGTNRVGILIQNGVASWGFWREGVSGIRPALPLVAPVAVGALLGATLATRLTDAGFERAFGVLMLVLLVPTLRRRPAAPRRPLAPTARHALFFAIGLYGGAFQAGVGILLLYGLAGTGSDLVRSNAVKVVLNFCFSLLVLPIFVSARQVALPEAAALATGFAAGGWLGPRVAVRGGERIIKPVLAIAVVALAARMLGIL
ncbi:MAG: sulfite exporter TauE/SafE family protein [Myxococcota bacterium]